MLEMMLIRRCPNPTSELEQIRGGIVLQSQEMKNQYTQIKFDVPVFLKDA